MTPRMNVTRSRSLIVFTVLSIAIAGSFAEEVLSQIGRFAARDPGVRSGSTGSGGMLSGLTVLEQQVFGVGREAFQEVASVQGTIPGTEAGLGPRFNLDSCPVVTCIRT